MAAGMAAGMTAGRQAQMPQVAAGGLAGAAAQAPRLAATGMPPPVAPSTSAAMASLLSSGQFAGGLDAARTPHPFGPVRATLAELPVATTTVGTPVRVCAQSQL